MIPLRIPLCATLLVLFGCSCAYSKTGCDAEFMTPGSFHSYEYISTDYYLEIEKTLDSTMQNGDRLIGFSFDGEYRGVRYVVSEEQEVFRYQQDTIGHRGRLEFALCMDMGDSLFVYHTSKRVYAGRQIRHYLDRSIYTHVFVDYYREDPTKDWVPNTESWVLDSAGLVAIRKWDGTGFLYAVDALIIDGRLLGDPTVSVLDEVQPDDSHSDFGLQGRRLTFSSRIADPLFMNVYSVSGTLLQTVEVYQIGGAIGGYVNGSDLAWRLLWTFDWSDG